MIKFDSALVATHIVYRRSPPFEPLEGPYSSVANALTGLVRNVTTCQIPILGFDQPLLAGTWKKETKYKLPKFLGYFPAFKYLVDFLLFIFFLLKFAWENRGKNKLVVGIDPLSCLPLTFFKNILGYRLVFYSVDFNRTRFKNKILQFLYEKSDELASQWSDQTWVVCQSLHDYKKNNYGVESIYIPNSPIFNSEIYEKGKNSKKGNKMAWTGSFLTDRQYEILFSLLTQIQEIRPDLEFYLAPMNDHNKFRDYSLKYKLNKCEVLELHSRGQWQQFAVQCDVGVAIYDPKFGSTEFIEPLKIWDFMLCGMPFIISCEPSISDPIKNSGVAYFLQPENKLPNDDSLKNFLTHENIKRLEPVCLKLAEEFDIQKQIQKALAKLL